MYSWWLQKKKLPVWNWNIKPLRGGVSRIRRRGTGRRRNASWLCLWNYLRFLTTIRAQSGFSFSQKTTFCIFLLNAVTCFFLFFFCWFVFSCVCTVNGIFIILIYLFKLTVFMEIFNHLLAVFKIKQKKVFLYFLFEAIYLWNRSKRSKSSVFHEKYGINFNSGTH